MLIPKVIHYCWFGNEKLPTSLMNCMKTWEQHLPEFKLKRWDESSFDVSSVPFVWQAYQLKKWAFVADYVRFYALYVDGGLYMDTDVKVLKAFPSEWFDNQFFTAHEVQSRFFETKNLENQHLPSSEEVCYDGINMLSAVMASTKHHPFVRDCRNWYEGEAFLDSLGRIRPIEEIIIGRVLAKVASEYGYIAKHVEQHLSHNILVLTANVLSGNSLHQDEHTYAIHLVDGSWHDRNFFNRAIRELGGAYPALQPVLNVIVKAGRKLLGVLSK